jgi:hypothetical protein
MAPVKKFWLLLLAFVLPLQMSWANVHVCDESSPAIAASQVIEANEHHSDVGNAAERVDANAVADSCCCASHSCHGLQSLMAAGQALGLRAEAAGTVADFTAALSGQRLGNRIERPQWLAA